MIPLSTSALLSRSCFTGCEGWSVFLRHALAVISAITGAPHRPRSDGSVTFFHRRREGGHPWSHDRYARQRLQAA